MTGRPVPRGDLRLEALAVPAGEAALAVLPRLQRALAGGAPVAPHADTTAPPPLPPHGPADLPDDLAVVVGTSGSTGAPKLALLTTGALRASARATHERLGGPGQWLLPLPAHHVAGLQVLLRSIDAGTTPVAVDLSGGFTPQAFTEAAARLDPGSRHYTSLVPAQLTRLLDDAAGARALRGLDAVLVGGAALPPPLRARAASAGVTVVATYGMSETAGGCVYDGEPLSCTTIEIDDTGRVHLGGDTLALGYLGRPDLTQAAFRTDEQGTRWFRTDDVGHTGEDGRLHVDGRVDDLVNTGGLKVAPRLVEEAVLAHVPGVHEVVVVGTPHPQWGEAVSALLVMGTDAGRPAPTTEDVRAALRGVLPDHALPVRTLVTDHVPTRGPGKPDRRAVTEMFTVGG